MAGGLVVAAVGFGLLTRVEGPSSLAVLVTAFVVFSLGLAPVFTLATDIIIGSVPPERAGVASAISETGSEFGGALGVAILGSIGTAVYRGAMTGGVSSAIPRESAAAARDTLGGAVAVAMRLPDKPGAELLGTAREAFAQALELAALISAAIVLATAVMVVLRLKNLRTVGEH
jgi:DHA2 family multidrug resistance protein-like MFS transporter